MTIIITDLRIHTLTMNAQEYCGLPIIGMRILLSFPTENLAIYSKLKATMTPAKNPRKA